MSIRYYSVLAIILAGAWIFQGCATESEPTVDTSHGDRMVEDYFRSQVHQIEANWDDKVTGLQEWRSAEADREGQLRDMLGLDPMPERTPLEATVTGTLDHAEFTVEKLHFQSIPGLYVTANLYVPKDVENPMPGIVYVCGHANRFEDGVSLGSKTAYQRHPAWFARHGYVALIIDTIQLHEIEGVHHGTHNEGRWWWWNRGYTPLGVETWNTMRALDYLETRPEVDADRLGVAGRSGGGIYSWTTLAVDDRVKAAVPTAGIADLESMVMDEVVGNHCDCMFHINSRRWDLTEVAAMANPTPTLLVNGDHDPLFPLDGVHSVYHKTRQLYALSGTLGDWDRLIADAPHADIFPIRQGMYRWMHRHLKGEELTVVDTARAYFEPSELKVFDEIPGDQINTEIDERFVDVAETPSVPTDRESWEELQSHWMMRLAEDTFNGWPALDQPPSVEKVHETTFDNIRLSTYEFPSQEDVNLRTWVLQQEDAGSPDTVTVSVVDEEGWQHWMGALQSALSVGVIDTSVVGPGARATPWPGADGQALERITARLDEGQAVAVVAPRGIGPTTWSQNEPGYEVRRSFMLLGQTRDGMRVWDVRRAVQALQTQSELRDAALRLEGSGVMGGIALYAGIYEPAVDGLHLHELPSTHRNGPILLNVRKVFDMPQALGLARDRIEDIHLYGVSENDWEWARALEQQVFEGEFGLQFVTGEPTVVARQ
jgi:dienelactone hydrolase